MKDHQLHIFILLTLILLVSGNVMASEFAVINNLNVQNGLAGESVFKIFKDRYGIIWIGTGNGLNSFNGYRLRSFNVTSNRELNAIYDIAQTADNNIYVGTSAGAYVFSSDRNDLKRIIPESKGSVHALATDGNTLYLGSDDGLYTYYCGKVKHYIVSRDRMTENNVLKDIFVDGKRRVWLLSNSELYLFDNVKQQMKAFNLKRQINFIGTLHTLTVVGNMVYIGSDNAGLFVFNVSHGKFSHYVDAGCNVITDLSTDNKNLYVATDGNGAHVISLKNNRITNSYNVKSSLQLQDNSVYCFYHDKSGVNWFGYYRRGVSYNYYCRPLFHVYSFGSFKSDHINVRSFYINGNQKIIGTRNGLYFIDENTNIVRYFPPSVIGGSIITSICYYDGKYYVATYDGGVSIFNPSTFTFSRFLNNPALMTGSFSKLLVSPQNELWMGGNQGVFVFNSHRSAEMVHYSQKNSQLYNSYVNNMMFDRQGRCWISTQKGLCIYNPQEGIIHSSGFPSGFVNNVSELNCTLGDNDNIVCYSLAGLFRTNEDMDRFHSISLQKSVWNNFISMVIYDRKYGQYWIGTEKGLFCFDRDFRSFRHYGDEYNMTGKEFSTGSCRIDDSDNLWIGSLNGLIYANIDALNKYNDEPFSIVADDVSINNEEVDKVKETELLINHKISLMWNIVSQKLSFKPIVLNYGNPDGNYYEYQVNSDEPWTVIDDKSFVTCSSFHLGINKIYLRVAGSKTIITFTVVVYPSMWAIVELILFICLIIITRIILMKRKAYIAELEAHRAADEAAENAKYSRVKMNDMELEQLYQLLTTYMETEKPYLDPSLKLSDIASALGCSGLKLSQTLNMYVHHNYYDFINSYRLEEFKQRLTDKAYSRYTLIALSEQCGFKKSSFFSTFKKMMGITPAEYLHQIGKQ
jgi:ligand-binding sensor domain-containing protein/AraC-like DNA-binding protein